MPSHIHQSLITLLTESPDIVPRLLRDLLGQSVPEAFEVMAVPETVREMSVPEYTTDGTVLVHNPADGSREALIVEVQLRPDPGKHRSWPMYIAGLRARLGCPTSLLVVTTDERTARWCATPVDLGRGCLVLQPMVIGPSDVPRVLDQARARRQPELAVLAVIMHGRGPTADRRALGPGCDCGRRTTGASRPRPRCPILGLGARVSECPDRRRLGARDDDRDQPLHQRLCPATRASGP